MNFIQMAWLMFDEEDQQQKQASMRRVIQGLKPHGMMSPCAKGNEPSVCNTLLIMHP
jgi:hypothetical protein